MRLDVAKLGPALIFEGDAMKKPVVIGCGNMGSAVIEALIQQGIYVASAFTIVEKQPNPFVDRYAGLKATILKSIDHLTEQPELVIAAVKPQDATVVLKKLGMRANPDTLLISIMAGVSIAELESYLPSAQIIRCMPNMPCLLKQGMTVYCGNGKVTRDSFDLTQTILSAMGKAFRVADEIMIDAATAISGSGPAYVFFLAEALTEGAVLLGFNREQAEVLARQTLLGAAMLLDRSEDPPEELRRRVTSPGGTTEAAFQSFMRDNVKTLLINGFKAAYNRSLELGKQQWPE